MNTQRALLGKIARLPHHIRQQLNRRLHDGQSSPDILPWLNALPAVQKILAQKFAGKPVTHRNISNWRAIGYQQWLEQEQPFLCIKEQTRHARRYARLARGLADGAAAIAAERLFQALRSNPNISAEDLLKIIPSINALVKAGQNNVRLKYSKRKLRQGDAHLRLMRDKHHRDVISIGQRLLDDERAKIIQYGPFSNAEKIELLGRHIFGEFWQPRILPVPGQSPAHSSSSSKNNPADEGGPAASKHNEGSHDSLSQRERDGVREKAHEKDEPNESGSSSSSKNETTMRPPESLDATRNTHHANPPIHQPLAAPKPAPAGEGGSTINSQPSGLRPPEITPGKTTAQLIAEIEDYAIQDAAARRAAASNESSTRPPNSLSACPSPAGAGEGGPAIAHGRQVKACGGGGVVFWGGGVKG